MKIQIQWGNEHPKFLDFHQLEQFDCNLQVPDVSKVIPGREGGGVLFRGLLESLKPQGMEIEKISLNASHDQFEKSIPWQLIPEEAVLVYQRSGEEIPIEQGGPYRLYVPGTVVCGKAELDNCVNVKHLDRIDVELATV